MIELLRVQEELVDRSILGSLRRQGDLEPFNVAEVPGELIEAGDGCAGLPEMPTPQGWAELDVVGEVQPIDPDLGLSLTVLMEPLDEQHFGLADAAEFVLPDLFVDAGGEKPKITLIDPGEDHGVEPDFPMAEAKAKAGIHAVDLFLELSNLVLRGPSINPADVHERAIGAFERIDVLLFPGVVFFKRLDHNGIVDPAEVREGLPQFLGFVAGVSQLAAFCLHFLGAGAGE